MSATAAEAPADALTGAPTGTAEDAPHMRAAIALARRGLGETAPNPSVGCLIVRDGMVIARGRTAGGGRPHAEKRALEAAGAAARGACAYVSLEPCARPGSAAPCADALIAAGIARVVIGAPDPNPRVAGRGVALLRQAGIAVTENLLRDEAAAAIAGFAMVHTAGRPLLRLKLATSLDGRIATAGRESQWITGEAARRVAQAMRGRHDAVMVGIGTVLADDPELTCRLPGFRSTPLIRIVLDSRLRIPTASRLLRATGAQPLWLLHGPAAPPQRRVALEQAGARLFELPGSETGIDLPAAMRALAAAGPTRILAEGGGRLAAALLRDHLVDRLAWFHAGGIIGGDGLPAIAELGISRLSEMPRFLLGRRQRWGDDVLSSYRAVSPCSPA